MRVVAWCLYAAGRVLIFFAGVVFDSIFFLTDPANTEVLYVSPGYEKIWGRPVSEVYDKPQSWGEAVVPEDRKLAGKMMLEWSKKEMDTVLRIARPDGTERTVNIRSTPIKDDAGAVTRIAGVVTDITEQKLESEAYQKQNIQLEKALGLMAGRELSMVSLKKENERLIAEIEQLKKNRG